MGFKAFFIWICYEDYQKSFLGSLFSFTHLRTYPELTDGLIVAVSKLHSDLHDVPLLISPDHVSGLPGVSAHVTRVILRHVTSALIIILVTGSNETLPEFYDNKCDPTLLILTST